MKENKFSMNTAKLNHFNVSSSHYIEEISFSKHKISKVFLLKFSVINQKKNFQKI